MRQPGKAKTREAGELVGRGNAPAAKLHPMPSLEEAGELFLQENRYHPAGSAADKRFRFTRRMTLINRRWRTRVDERLRRIGQTEAGWLALFWISVSREGANQRELAERIGIEGPTLVRLLNRLEQQGLVERHPVEGDRRVKTLKLTEAAKPLLVEISATIDQLREELMQDIRPEELEVCLSVLARIQGRLE